MPESVFGIEIVMDKELSLPIIHQPVVHDDKKSCNHQDLFYRGLITSTETTTKSRLCKTFCLSNRQKCLNRSEWTMVTTDSFTFIQLDFLRFYARLHSCIAAHFSHVILAFNQLLMSCFKNFPQCLSCSAQHKAFPITSAVWSN